ncbi:MAG TPA: STAS domain-containing protein [Sporichthyaceae bacterium]|jgi:anti-anti-sigma factor|nr:STAS domain-containing protein [Sporichthyaceae bacterium]
MTFDPADTRLRIRHGPSGEVLVAGSVDLSGARALRRELTAAAARHRPLVVDLTAVQLLQSVGVAVLHDLADHGLVLRTRTGSAVASVIRITGLIHVASIEFVEPEQACDGTHRPPEPAGEA